MVSPGIAGGASGTNDDGNAAGGGAEDDDEEGTDPVAANTPATGPLISFAIRALLSNKSRAHWNDSAAKNIQTSLL